MTLLFNNTDPEIVAIKPSLKSLWDMPVPPTAALNAEQEPARLNLHSVARHDCDYSSDANLTARLNGQPGNMQNMLPGAGGNVPNAGTTSAFLSGTENAGTRRIVQELWNKLCTSTTSGVNVAHGYFPSVDNPPACAFNQAGRQHNATFFITYPANIGKYKNVGDVAFQNTTNVYTTLHVDSAGNSYIGQHFPRQAYNHNQNQANTTFVRLTIT